MDDNDTNGTDSKPKRAHKATYATDKVNGGYLIRIIGPSANRFANRKIPVVRKDDTESEETTGALIWTGKDKETGAPVALYKLKKSEKKQEDIPF